ncbi:MAG: 5-formyltetrahydrofolate cyclo-ligase, partial [Actinobacteria bacterium]|nr:5-formyltetrahydrofolate cyclo-ligase [Actinomycetota bacterium]
MDEEAKWELRRRFAAARRAVPAAVREAESAALAAARLPLGLPGTVCAYWPVDAEPGSPALLDALVCRGCQVLLPVVGSPGAGVAARSDPAPLDWAEYTGVGSLRVGPFGLYEPTGPRLGCAAITTAVLVLVPA